MSTTTADVTGITDHESKKVERANESGRTPVVFIHGLWLLPSSWDRWATLFENAGYTAVQPGWPDDPETVVDARAHPDAFAGKSVGQVADHPGVTEIKKIPGRGHALTIDGGWKEVAETALAFVQRFV